ncbi:PXA domain-containing protein [Podospora didyma]|uniref:PXA domain-containing protein n=1 Tax=Podospora didyma TaxID=330526 RepID=A0AAE0N8Y5_9PEZI|nr:PXA domain-containing protein [Podospora didyma]
MTTADAQGPVRAPTPIPTPTYSSYIIRPKQPLSSETAATSTTTASQPQPPESESASPVRSATPQPRAGGAARRGTSTATSPDALSDRATANLVRRILCPQHFEKGKNSASPSIEGLLPPLTSRNDVDLQLYALIAIILREYVQNWYTKITPDETFVAEIVQIIAHCTTALEQRMRKVDLESLLFDELPELLDRHITAYRAAHDPIVQPPVATNPRQIYHSLCPLPALSPAPCPRDPKSIAQQAENEVAYRQLLVHGVLALLLPTEDLENGCLTALVGQIFSELIIGNVVVNKLSAPWLIWEMLIIVSNAIARRRGAGIEASKGRGGPSEGRRSTFSIQSLFWTILQWCFLATSFFRTIFAILVASRTVPPRISRSGSGSGSIGAHEEDDAAHHRLGTDEHMQAANPLRTGSEPLRVPVVTFRSWTAVSNLIELDVRMPWLYGTLSILQWIAMTGPGRVANVDGMIDRLLSYGIHSYLLDPASLPPLLRNVRAALFPNNLPGSPTLKAPSSDAELLSLRRRCANALWGLIPKGVGRLYFGGRRGDRGGPVFVTVVVEEEDKGISSSSGSTGSRGGPGNDTSIISRPPQLLMTRGSATQEQQQQPSGEDDREGSSRPLPSTTLPQRTAPKNRGHDHHSTSPSPSTAAPASSNKKSKAVTVQNVHYDEEKDDDDVDQEVDDEHAVAEIESGILDVFSDAYCNKHFVYSIVELILVRLLPELSETGVVDLWAERLP